MKKEKSTEELKEDLERSSEKIREYLEELSKTSKKRTDIPPHSRKLF